MFCFIFLWEEAKLLPFLTWKIPLFVFNPNLKNQLDERKKRKEKGEGKNEREKGARGTYLLARLMSRRSRVEG